MRESTGKEAKIGCAWKTQDPQLRALVASRTNLKTISKTLGRNMTGVIKHCKILNIDISNLRTEEEEDATEKQISTLNRNKIAFDRATITKTSASKLIGAFFEEENKKRAGPDIPDIPRLATQNQIDSLKKNGVDVPVGLTFDEASTRLDEIHAKRPPTEKQARALGAMGFKPYHIREMTSKYASSLIHQAQLRR